MNTGGAATARPPSDHSCVSCRRARRRCRHARAAGGVQQRVLVQCGGRAEEEVPVSVEDAAESGCRNACGYPRSLSRW